MSSMVLAARCASAGKGCRPCPPYLCKVGRMTADPSMPASGRLPRVKSVTLAGQLSGGARTWRPVLRGREDVTIRSIFAISELVKDTNDILPFK
ncbi:hypothetical protein GW17_00062036 [Ensete ventricosum]|nr:hypothetical protein GW17_00062036 [Ensete ventricosum]